MQRIEAAIRALRLVMEHKELSYSYDRVIQGLNVLDFEHEVVTDENGGKHLRLAFDDELILHFTYDNNHYEIPKYNIIHGFLNEITKYYNEMVVDNYIDPAKLDMCFRDLEMLETVGIESWADKQVAVHQVLKLFNDDEMVATLMFLKYIGEKSNRSISYIERHFTPVTYRGVTTEMCIELYNMNYYRMLTIDIDHCQIVDDLFDTIVTSFKRWYK